MQRTWSRERLAWALALASIGVLALGGCQRSAPSPTPTAMPTDPATVTPTAPAYTAPTADQLYRLVAPIALFPDKLLAQTLAASVYPDQVLTAQDWLRSKRALTAADRAQATVAQPWDPSVKALTAFPDVVDQLAGNLDWTRALGEAYAHDPNDVLDAVQIMRQRAQASGHLRSTSQQQVQVARHVVVTPILDGERVPPPSQVITIEPAQPQVVYVPHYDPDVVYGTPVNVYREYRYRPVRWYDQGDVATVGAVSFGAGVLVGSALEHHHGWFGWATPAPAWHHWGWNSWGVEWNAPPAAPHYVVYQNRVYAPRTTIINNHTTVVEARSSVHQQDQRQWSNTTYTPVPGPEVAKAAPPAARTAMPTAAAAAAPSLGTLPRPTASAPSPAELHHAPDVAHLSAPHFTAQMLQAGRPVAARAPQPVPVSLPSPARPANTPHPTPATEPPGMRTGESPVAQARMPSLPAHQALPAGSTRPASEPARETARPTLSPREAFTARNMHDIPPRTPAPLQPRPPQLREQPRVAPRQQAALVVPPRAKHQLPVQLPRPEPRPLMQIQAQQRPQRVATFATPRAAPVHAPVPRPSQSHAQAPPHHERRHDS